MDDSKNDKHRFDTIPFADEDDIRLHYFKVAERHLRYYEQDEPTRWDMAWDTAEQLYDKHRRGEPVTDYYIEIRARGLWITYKKNPRQQHQGLEALDEYYKGIDVPPPNASWRDNPPETEAMLQEHKARARKAVKEKLKPGELKVLLDTVQGKSNEETAKALGIPEKTIPMRRCRARQKALKVLEELADAT